MSCASYIDTANSDGISGVADQLLHRIEIHTTSRFITQTNTYYLAHIYELAIWFLHSVSVKFWLSRNKLDDSITWSEN